METEETVTLEQAGSRFGVDADALQRLIRIGALPEARKEIRPSGGGWVISAAALPVIAQRQGWTIDLRGDEPVIALDDYRQPATAGAAAVSPFFDGIDTTEFAPLDGAMGEMPPLASMDEIMVATELTMQVETVADDGGELPDGRTGDERQADPGAALVPHGASAPDSGETQGAPSIGEVLDLHLLDRLLGVQEERIHAVAEASQTRQALEVTSHDLDSTKAELEVQRREHLIASDRFREERMARAVSDAKVAELRDRVIREMALAEAEKEARAEAITRSIRAERDAAAAMASMGWRARRRFRRQLDT